MLRLAICCALHIDMYLASLILFLFINVRTERVFNIFVCTYVYRMHKNYIQNMNILVQSNILFNTSSGYKRLQKKMSITQVCVFNQHSAIPYAAVSKINYRLLNLTGFQIEFIESLLYVIIINKHNTIRFCCGYTKYGWRFTLICSYIHIWCVHSAVWSYFVYDVQCSVVSVCVRQHAPNRYK